MPGENKMLQIYSTQPNLTVINGEIKTTSLIVADHFGRMHKNILRDIEAMECSDKFRLLNFEPSYYIAENGKKERCYEITKNGFMFLALGFTGKKAAEIREAYIEEFERMANEIRPKANIKLNINKLTANNVRFSECLNAIKSTGSNGLSKECLIEDTIGLSADQRDYEIRYLLDRGRVYMKFNRFFSSSISA